MWQFDTCVFFLFHWKRLKNVIKKIIKLPFHSLTFKHCPKFQWQNKTTAVDIIKRNRGTYSYCIFTESGTCKMLSKFPSSNRHMPWNGTSSAQSVGKKERNKKKNNINTTNVKCVLYCVVCILDSKFVRSNRGYMNFIIR